jgi:4-amino-4-deoxy-L-arabinose transferase-like glycosyltransferase
MSEITKTEDQKPKTDLIRLLFALVIVIAYLTGLSIPLLGPDEPRYSEVAREMFLRGDWVTPTLGGFDWFEKPALLYWLQIVSYNLFGVSEFAARFGSALFGLGTIFSLWILGRQADKIRNPKSEIQNSANYLALVAASSIGLIAFSRGASFDIILTFPVTAALVSFFIWETGRRETQSKKGLFSKTSVFSAALICFYFFIGVALIAKGLVGIVFPLGIVAFYYLLSRKLPPKTFIFSLFWGTLVSLAVAALWYLPMYRANGWKFVDEFFIQHHFQRYTSNKYQHPQPFYFFFWVLPLMTLPWLPFFLASLWRIVKDLISRKGAKPQSADNQPPVTPSPRHPVTRSPLLLFAVSWLLVPLVFFSVSGSKLPGYILPALPAALILAGEAVWRFVQKSRARQIAVQTIGLVVIIGAAVLAQFFIGGFLHEETVKHLIDTADSKGHASEKILTLHTISHSAEFYGAGRLVREPDGKQKRLYGVSQVLDEMNRENVRQILVIVPIVYQSQLTRSELLEAEVLDDNGELAIVYVRLR